MPRAVFTLRFIETYPIYTVSSSLHCTQIDFFFLKGMLSVFIPVNDFHVGCFRKRKKYFFSDFFSYVHSFNFCSVLQGSLTSLFLLHVVYSTFSFSLLCTLIEYTLTLSWSLCLCLCLCLCFCLCLCLCFCLCF